MKILLVDYHILFRNGIASLLRNEADIEIVSEVSNINEAVSMVMEFQPDLVLMEFGCDVADDLVAVRTIITLYPESPIVLLTNHDPDNVLVSALRAGVKGYISKDSSFKQVLASIQAIERGEMALSRLMTSRAIDLLFDNEKDHKIKKRCMDSLTTREMEILNIIATGASNRTIAGRLSISENTVKIHVHKILKKLKVRNRREAARYANQIDYSIAPIDISLEQYPQ